MFDTTFYRINADFDSNLTEHTSFEIQYDYVLRFVVDGWESSMPDRNQLLATAGIFATCLADTDDLASYDVKSVILQKVPVGEAVGYYSPSWYTLPFGAGYTEKFNAGDSTWTIDLVFRPRHAEMSRRLVEPLTQILSGNLAGSRGSTRVFCAGLISLDPEMEFPDDIHYSYIEAISFFSSLQAFWEVYKVENKDSDTGFIGKTRQINERPPMQGWNVFAVANQIGHNGYGVSKGSAFRPYSLEQLEVAGTILHPGSGGGPTVEAIPLDPATGLPVVASPRATWQNLSTFQKASAALGGAAMLTTVVWAWRRLNEY